MQVKEKTCRKSRVTKTEQIRVGELAAELRCEDATCGTSLIQERPPKLSVAALLTSYL